MDNITRLNQEGQAPSLEIISPRDAQEIIAKNPKIKLLDIRSVLEFNQVHIKDSINIAIDTLSFRIKELSKPGQGYIIFCRTGNRSLIAADMLLQAGIHNIKIMEGGITRWQKDKMPVIRGKVCVSLERQIRIIAGSLFLFGIIMSWFVHQAFIGISIFISCGLIYSGITDNCLMGMLLMKLPYNKNLYPGFSSPAKQAGRQNLGL